MTVQKPLSDHALEHRPSQRGRVQVLLLVTALATYAALAADVALGGPLSVLDLEISQLASPVRSGALTSLAEVLATVGWTPVQIAALVIVAAGIAVKDRRIVPLVVAALAGLLLVVLVISLKTLTGRGGPQDPAGEVAWGGAFPSGHAAAAVVATSVLILLTADRFSVAATRWLVAAGAVWAGLVGWSRVHLDVHWFSDVLAGWAIGIVVACAASIASDVLSRRREVNQP